MDKPDQIGIEIDMAVFKNDGSNITEDEMKTFNLDLIELAIKHGCYIGGSLFLCDESGKMVEHNFCATCGELCTDEYCSDYCSEFETIP